MTHYFRVSFTSRLECDQPEEFVKVGIQGILLRAGVSAATIETVMVERLTEVEAEDL